MYLVKPESAFCLSDIAAAEAFSDQITAASSISHDAEGPLSAGFVAKERDFHNQLTSAKASFLEAKVINIEQILLLALRLKSDETDTQKQLIADGLAMAATIPESQDGPNPCEQFLSAARKISPPATTAQDQQGQ